MSEIDQAILAYYDGNAAREHGRLDREDCALESALTTRLLADHLPAEGRVLEMGAAPAGTRAGWWAGDTAPC